MKRILRALICCALLVGTGVCMTSGADRMIPEMSTSSVETKKIEVRKVLFLGDSMTGWMAERMNAYGVKDGFEVATIVWDGSTIKKWASSVRLPEIIKQIDPDVIFVSLGMNDLFEMNPQKNIAPVFDKLMKSFGDTPVLWVGPPSWPGHNKGKVFVDWLATRLGPGHFFNSFNLTLPRQSKTNPHPSKAGIIKWMDDLVEWIPVHTDLKFPSLLPPAPNAMSRGKYFKYLRMKESL